ncbi:MAG: hypothetical protein Q8L55_09175 [Phycisphaerales bacterium]|nr:hypothetical protein [Phycisphaerales bacterium]
MNVESDFPHNRQPQRLCPRSSEAVDAFVERGFDIESLAPEHRERCSSLSSLLGRLKQGQVPCCCADESVSRTLARVAAAKSPQRFDLSDADADAMELLVAHGWDTRRVPAAMRARAERQAQLLSLLETAAPAGESCDALVAATLRRVERESQNQSRRMHIHEPAAAQRRTLRLTDIGAIAALLLVAVSVAWPALSTVRQRAQQTACFGNLGAIGEAVAAYGNQNRSALPMATASLAGNTWWNVGRPAQSNSANLFTLARNGYTAPQQLACCANAAARECRFTSECRDWQNLEQVSYSYQNLFANDRPNLDNPGKPFIVLADRNPAVLRAFRGERVVYVNENSPNHRGKGQNVLYSDGHGEWTESPVVDGDNIWLPRSIEDLIASVGRGVRPGQSDPLTGIEIPAKSDTFLCP